LALDPVVEVVTAPVVSVDLSFVTEAEATGHYSAAPDVLSSGRSGVVTGVDAKRGAILKAGSVVYHVDGFPVRAYYSKTVLFRPLELRDQGLDVRAAQRLLRVLLPKSEVPVDGVVGAAMVSAVKDYERAHGVVWPTGIMDPTWFVRIPTKAYEVGSVPLVVGKDAPGRGEPVVVAKSRLTRAALTPAGGTTGGPDGVWTFACAGRETAVTREGDTWTFQNLDELAVMLGPTNPDGSDPTVAGSLRVADPREGQGVPPAAVVYSPSDSSMCVLVKEADGSTTTHLLSAVESSIGGLAVFEPTLAPGAEVVMNPVEAVAGGAECRSP